MEIGQPDQNTPSPQKPPKLKVPDLSRLLPVLRKILNQVLHFLIHPANRKKVIIAGSIFLAVLIIRSVFFPAENHGHKKGGKEEVVRKEETPVKVFKVGRFNFEDSLNSLGTMGPSVRGCPLWM